MCFKLFHFHLVVIDVHVFLMFSYVWFMFIRSNMFWFDFDNHFTSCVVSCCCFFTCSSWLFDFPSCVPHLFCCLQGVFIRQCFSLCLHGKSIFLTHTNPYLANLQKTEEGVSRSVASAARRVTLPTANFHLQSLHTCPLETLLGGIGTLVIFFSMMYRGIVYCILCIIFAGQTPTMINPWWICFCRFRLITVDVAIPQVKLSQ